MRSLLVILCVALISGCDMLPGSGKKNTAQSGSTATVAASVPAVPAGDVLATVNGAQLSKGDLELRIQELKQLVQNAGQQWKPISKDQLEALLEDMVNSEVMTQAALSSKLDQSVDVQRKLAYARRQLMTQEWARSMQDKLKVEDADIEKYYEENKQGFREPPRIQLRRIVVSTESDAKKAMAALFGESADFATLAGQVSEGPEAADGGLMSKWIMRRQDAALVYRSIQEAEEAGVTVLEPALESVAFSINDVKGASNYAKGADGKFHLFQLADRQDGKQRDLATVHDNIKAFLTIQKVQEAIVSLKQSAKVERFVDRLEQVSQ